MAARDVTIGYGGDPVVTGASVEVAAGRVTALVGPNGSGKSTLLRGMARLQKLSAGGIELSASDAAALSAREFARRVTLLSQSRPTPAGITVRDAVEFGRHPHRQGWRGTDPEGRGAVDRALGLAGIADLADQDLDALSGGQVQRVWFASALAQDTGVLLLDEPTNHLDLRYQVEVLELVRELADVHDVAVGVVLHDLEQAAAVADRVLVLAAGQVVADGPPEHALTSALLSEVYEIEIEAGTTPSGHVTVRAPRLQLRRVRAAEHIPA
ncbi:ABC transporter ATP-binding protein [Cellulomonas denverensis]|uniref:ABC transporter ATP-binding protein n=1 Tax=Cellulomonas denverensis TaxID=264297 RepID=A0A7X6KTI6_9CELL|nr:ABC transporter ATP-binding protein [Cellulomonas denverensis]NKY22004.1 ABC transporter ATP-binding protein [Cellulomonas denverensis]GIG24103.1 ABC transporter ATP-binding protein [Cellulomonas denverensis]